MFGFMQLTDSPVRSSQDGVNIRLEILIFQGQLQTLNGEEARCLKKSPPFRAEASCA